MQLARIKGRMNGRVSLEQIQGPLDTSLPFFRMIPDIKTGRMRKSNPVENDIVPLTSELSSYNLFQLVSRPGLAV